MAIAIDFETFYGGEYSLKHMNTWKYVNDEQRFDPYLVAIHSDDLSYTGPVAGAPWGALVRRELVAHNATFETMILDRLMSEGKIPPLGTPVMHDTVDLAGWMRTPRDLKKASKALLGVEVSKEVRKKMENRRFESLTPAERKAVIEYGGRDAVLCHDIFKQYSPQWPAHEQRMSQLNREAAMRGFRVDKPALDRAIDDLLAPLVWAAERSLPWTPDKKPLSMDAIRDQGRAEGIPVPASLAQTDEDANEWEDKYAEKYPWVRAIRIYRRANALLQKLITLREGIRPDGCYTFQLKYFGAHTGRFSGGGKFNIQNLPRLPASVCLKCLYFDFVPPDRETGLVHCPTCGKPAEQVDVRGMVLPPEGHIWLAPDYSQIEARMLRWRVGDADILDQIRAGMNIYSVAAMRLMGMPADRASTLKKKEPDIYHAVKGSELACGFQMSAKRFFIQVPLLTGGAYRPTMAEAERDVARWREKNPKVVNHWYRHQDWLAFSANHGDAEHVVPLASGRNLTYWNPRWCASQFDKSKKSIKAEFIKTDTPLHVYGGKLTENEIQALARDVMVSGWLRAADAGILPSFTVHDELVAPVALDSVKDAIEELTVILRTPPEWAKDLPLDIEMAKMERYAK